MCQYAEGKIISGLWAFYYWLRVEAENSAHYEVIHCEILSRLPSVKASRCAMHSISGVNGAWNILGHMFPVPIAYLARGAPYRSVNQVTVLPESAALRPHEGYHSLTVHIGTRLRVLNG